jgi:hypothetical protein
MKSPPKGKRKKKGATGGQRFVHSSAADSPGQARSVFIETPLARFMRAQSREKVLTD